MRILAATGHRPEAIGGYGKVPLLVEFAIRILQRLAPGKVILGMALGWDTAIAMGCIRLDIPFVAAVPFKGQESIWPKESQRTYHNVLECASEVVIVCKGGFDSWKLRRRNEWMVDHATSLLALYNGGKSGGTYNCVKYAESKSIPMLNVWEEWVECWADNL